MRNQGFEKECRKQTNSKYWRMLRLKRKGKFWLRKNYFAVSRFLRGKLTGLKYLGSIVFLILASFVFALAIVVVSFTIEHFLPTMKISPFTGTLETLVQVSGIFLGLYFAAVSVVASTVYSRVPGKVRELLMTEKVSNLYIWIVALLGSVSLLLLAASSLGHEPGIICLLLITTLGALGIFGFVKLGMGVFNFFNPGALAPEVVKSIRDGIQAVTPAGQWYQDNSFQAYFRQKVLEALDTLKDIVQLVSNADTIDSTTLEALATEAIGLLPTYCSRKSTIPAKSSWYLPIYRHKDWLTADYLEVNLALSTGTAISPITDFDRNWFEDKVFEIATMSMESLLSHGYIDNAVNVISRMTSILFNLGKQLDVESAIAFSEQLNSMINKATLENAIDMSSEEGQEDLRIRLGFIELFGASLIAIALGYVETVKDIDNQVIDEVVQKLQSENRTTTMYSQLPSSVIGYLEQLRECLRIETEAENRIVSPIWYQKQLIAANILEAISGAFAHLLDELQRLITVAIQEYISKDKGILAIPLIQRSLELCNKVSHYVENIDSRFKELGELRLEISSPWPEFNPDKILEKIKDLENRTVQYLADLAPVLSKMPPAPEWPDYFGQAYEVVINSCYITMANGDIEAFLKLFPATIVSVSIAETRLKEKLTSEAERTSFIFSTEPIASLLELSGYAIIYQELHEKPFWDFVKSVWDNYLKEKDIGDFADSILAIVNARKSIFGISPRDLERTSWKQDLERRLRLAGYLRERFFYRPDFDDDESHIESPILRALIGQGEYVLYDAMDVFLSIYFEEEAHEKAERPKRVISFLQSLKRERGKD